MNIKKVKLQLILDQLKLYLLRKKRKGFPTTGFTLYYAEESVKIHPEFEQKFIYFFNRQFK
jgi:hypothetical protein